MFLWEPSTHGSYWQSLVQCVRLFFFQEQADWVSLGQHHDTLYTASTLHWPEQYKLGARLHLGVFFASLAVLKHIFKNCLSSSWLYESPWCCVQVLANPNDFARNFAYILSNHSRKHKPEHLCPNIDIYIYVTFTCNYFITFLTGIICMSSMKQLTCDNILKNCNTCTCFINFEQMNMMYVSRVQISKNYNHTCSGIKL